MECGYWTTFHVSHSLRQHDHCLSFVHNYSTYFPWFSLLLLLFGKAARHHQVGLISKGDVKQVPAAKVMTCARALVLFCWQVISVGAQVLRAMVANMGPMMASGDATRESGACGGSNQRPWYLQDPWWPEVQKNGWKRLGIERQNLRMLKDLRFSTRFHPNPWGSHTQSRQYQPHFPPAAQLQLWQSCSWTLSGRRRENTPPPESRWGHRAWHTSSALWPQTWAWPSCWDQTLPCLLFHCSSTNINNTTHLQKKPAKNNI